MLKFQVITTIKPLSKKKLELAIRILHFHMVICQDNNIKRDDHLYVNELSFSISNMTCLDIGTQLSNP